MSGIKTSIVLLTSALASGLSFCAGETDKRDLTVVQEEFKEKTTRPRDWTQRTNPLFALSAEGVDDIHLAYEGEPPPTLVLSNRTDSALELSGRISVGTFGGESFSLDASGTLGARSIRRVEVGRALKKGPWLAVASLETPDAKAVAETRFAVVRRREVTPPSPPGVFRAGFNYHMERYSDKTNEKCLKALVQSGAKIVRVGMQTTLSSVQNVEGKFDWTKPDRYLDLLERHGLAVNTRVYGTPRWAMDERRRNAEGVRGTWASPARPGIYRDFCEKISARYGTRIAWYEAGNELDLIPPEVLSIDEAIAMQREVYEGIKAGCPDAKVIPNGWAVVHSDVIPHRTQRNMQERLMTEARDFCDAHTVHQHGPYREYRRRLGEFFAWRKARGIDGMPWYSNETAQSVTGAGEERVAECVWQKILFAWAHGSLDYIWYNLRAIGYGPYDGEQGYGVVTADFYPRMSFAAFAGLTSCFEGLHPVECVHEGPSREIYRFAGDRGGRRVQVLVGWDIRSQTNVSVRVRTDAARAFAADIFDNRTPIEPRDGCATLTFGRTPGALVLEDAAVADPDAGDMVRGEKQEIQAIVLGTQPHCFRLNDYDNVFEMYKADPANFDRIWKGWNDLTATVRVSREGEKLKIVAEACDEKLAADDGLVVIVDGTETRFPPEKPIGAGARYVALVDFPKPDSVLEIRVEDDDGKGKEGWVTTGPFRFAAVADVRVDWSDEIGPVKPVNGVGQPPMIGKLSSWSMLHYLKEAGIPYSRLHDVGGWLGGGLYVDIPNLFPDFDADENDPKNYRFAYTDSLMKALADNGVEPFFRLGVTIENFVGYKERLPPKNILPPKDFEKWARICEHVVRHYTEGWADGFKMKVTYWEIWNEPDNHPDDNLNPMFRGPFSEYMRLYGVAATHLKKCFPHLKIGGYGHCGFYAGVGSDHVPAANSSPRMQHFVECSHKFLAAARDNKWPLDFFSYHSYSEPKEALRQVRFADEHLNEYGFTADKCERIFNEWLPYVKHENLGTALQAAGVAAELIGLQNGPCDLACIYDARCGVGNYSPLFNPLTYKPHKAYYAFTAFNELRKRGTAVRASSTNPGVWVAAAKGADGAAVMLANDSDEAVRLACDFQGRKVVVFRITDADRTECEIPFPNVLPPRSFAVAILR